MRHSLFWLSLTLLFILMEAFFSMMEMALVSFNKVRLQYYLNQNGRRARWIHSLLKSPARLFGTILLGINIALEFGSECSRQLYESWGLNPDIAPLTQVVLVVVFAELAPIFAARRYAEHVGMLGIPIIYAASIVLYPVVWLFGLLAKWVGRLFGSAPHAADIYLSREELQRVLEEKDEGVQQSEGEEFQLVVSNIFNLRNQLAKQIMAPLNSVKMVPSQCTVGEINAFLRKISYSHLPIYHRYRQQIVGLVSPRDLIKVPNARRVRDYARPPWFITENAPAMQIIKQFRINRQDVAVVLNAKGEAVGILTLEDILKQIFGDISEGSLPALHSAEIKPVVERNLPAETRIHDFNLQFDANLSEEEGTETLLDLAQRSLGEHPEKGASFRLGRYEFTVAETNLLGIIKSFDIRTLN